MICFDKEQKKCYTYIAKIVIYEKHINNGGETMDNKMLEWSEQISLQVHQLLQYYKKGTYDVPLQLPEGMRLGKTETDLLNLMSWNYDISIKDVIDELNLPNSTITSAVNRLESKGILIRTIHPEDKRSYSLQLTKSGQEIINYTRSKRNHFFFTLLQGLSGEEEKQVFVDMLSTITEAVIKQNPSLVRRVTMDAMMKEFNSFGQWLDEIKAEEDIPPQYAEKRDLILSAAYAFKVPRNIERRKAHPGMRLYDAVVMYFEESIQIMKVSGKKTELVQIPYTSIRYISHSMNLLDSHLYLVTDKDIHEIEYNSISADVMLPFVKKIRQKVFVRKQNLNQEVCQALGEFDSDLYRRVLKEENREEISLVDYQPFMQLKKVNPSAKELILHGNPKYGLQETYFLTDGKELIIVNRAKPVKRLKEEDYSYRQTYISPDHITELKIVDKPEMDHLKQLVIVMGPIEYDVEIGDTFTTEKLEKFLKLR